MTTSHSTGELVLVSTAALALGAAAGIAITSREAQSQLRRAKRKIMSALGLAKADVPNGPAVRTSDLPPGADPDAMANTRLAVVLRADELQDAGGLVAHAALTVLGHFKKLYKRRDPALRLWEGGGQRIEVRVASSEAVLVAVQEAARGAGLATHTFAGRPGAGRRERTLMVVGPADKAALDSVVGRLEHA